MRTQFRGEVEFDESTLALSVDESPSVDSEALHHPVRPRNRPIRQDPHRHGGRLRTETHPVPSVIVSSLRLGNLVVRLGLEGVDEIRELNRILDEEDGDV